LFLVFLLFYVGLFYNLPVLAAGVRDLRRGGKRRGEEKLVVAGEGLPRFSVILPVKNEVRVVGRVLDSLSRLSYPADRFEVVVADDGSVDGTVEVCERFVASHDNFMLVQRSVSCGKSSALNFGWSYCSGDIVAIFDADNVPAGDVLVRAAECFRDPGVAALQGRIHSINSHENMLTQFLAYEDAVWSEAFLRGKEALGLFVHLRGCCQFIRRSALEGVGGFDEGSLAEDMEISAHLTEQGHRIMYSGDVHAWQESPSTVGGFLRQRTRWYRGHMETALKYGRFLRHLNKRTLDAEFTLTFPFLAIASLFLFVLASWGVFASASFDGALRVLMGLSTFTMFVLVLLAGGALIYYSHPKRVKNLLWLPFVFGYWFAQSLVAVYAGLLILFRRPRRWVKTEKSGVVASPEFDLEVSPDLV
jgi:cellulose synthase/poly-beta-1,6-N-acetylglucosamine synthase-like glycosyltransferase